MSLSSKFETIGEIDVEIRDQYINLNTDEADTDEAKWGLLIFLPELENLAHALTGDAGQWQSSFLSMSMEKKNRIYSHCSQVDLKRERKGMN